MVGFILTGHGEFASGLGSAVEMIAGPQEDLTVVTFLEAEAGSFADKIGDAIKDATSRYDSVVVFCDLMGGTPFNQSMLHSAGLANVSVVTGTNLPMLLEALTSATPESTAAEIASLALEVGQAGIANPVLGADDEDDDDEDGI